MKINYEPKGDWWIPNKTWVASKPDKEVFGEKHDKRAFLFAGYHEDGESIYINIHGEPIKHHNLWLKKDIIAVEPYLKEYTYFGYDI